MHHSGNEQHADHRGVEKQRSDHAERDVLHHHDLGEPERAAHDDHDDGGGGDNGPRMCCAVPDGLVGGGTFLLRLHHAGDQEHLIVGGQAVDNGHDEHQDWAHEGACGEVEHAGPHAVDKHGCENAQGCPQTEDGHDDCLCRQDHGSKHQRHENERGGNDVEEHPRELAQQRLNGLHLQRGRAPNVDFRAFGCLDLAELLDHLCVIVAVGDARREHGSAVRGGPLSGEAPGQALHGVGLGEHLHELIVAGGACYHEFHRVGAEVGELFVEFRLGLADFVVRRQVGFVDTAKLHAHQRDRQGNEHGDNPGGDQPGVSHRPGGYTRPEAGVKIALRAGRAPHCPLVNVLAQQAKH